MDIIRDKVRTIGSSQVKSTPILHVYVENIYVYN